MTPAGRVAHGGPVAAVVVNYNAGELLGACVASLARQGADPVVVVDNGSDDGSLEAVETDGPPGVRAVRLGTNLGYGTAANRGVACVHSEAVLVCNPDVVVGEGALRALAGALDGDCRAGAAGPQVLEPDGALYPSARRFPTLAEAAGHAFVGLAAPRNRFTARYRMLDWDHSERRQVDWVSGACVLVRREAFVEVGGFDEGYFMYMEDVDLGWRLGRAGWPVIYEPAAKVTHVQGVSTARHPYRMAYAHHRSMLRYAGRTTEGPARAALPLVAFAIAGRGALACAKLAWELRTASPGGTRREGPAPGGEAGPG